VRRRGGTRICIYADRIDRSPRMIWLYLGIVQTERRARVHIRWDYSYLLSGRVGVCVVRWQNMTMKANCRYSHVGGHLRRYYCNRSNDVIAPLPLDTQLFLNSSLSLAPILSLLVLCRSFLDCLLREGADSIQQLRLNPVSSPCSTGEAESCRDTTSPLDLNFHFNFNFSRSPNSILSSFARPDLSWLLLLCDGGLTCLIHCVTRQVDVRHQHGAPVEERHQRVAGEWVLQDRQRAESFEVSRALQEIQPPS
jgi:hypothetical protein